MTFVRKFSRLLALVAFAVALGAILAPVAVLADGGPVVNEPALPPPDDGGGAPASFWQFVEADFSSALAVSWTVLAVF